MVNKRISFPHVSSRMNCACLLSSSFTCRKSKCHPNDTSNSNNNNIHASKHNRGSSRRECDDDVKKRFRNEGGGDRGGGGGGGGKGGDMGGFQSLQSAFCGRRPCAPTAPLPCRTPIGLDDKFQQTIADAEQFGCRPIRNDHLQNVSNFPVRQKGMARVRLVSW